MTLAATVRCSKPPPERDLIITSGGVSVGEEDHVKAAVEAVGKLDLWKIAIKPGKPLAFRRIGDKPFIGLPGNPVSAFVTFCLFVRPFILRSQGIATTAPQAFSLKADFDWLKPDKRREFLRARLHTTENGEVGVQLYPNQGSGVLTSTPGPMAWWKYRKDRRSIAARPSSSSLSPDCSTNMRKPA